MDRKNSNEQKIGKHLATIEEKTQKKTKKNPRKNKRGNIGTTTQSSNATMDTKFEHAKENQRHHNKGRYSETESTTGDQRPDTYNARNGNTDS